MNIKLPDDVITYEGEGYTAHTVPREGFEKLIGWQSEVRDWVHKDYRVETKKKKQKKKKKT